MKKCIDVKTAVANLSEFVKEFFAAHPKGTRPQFNEWKKENSQRMAELFGYVRLEGMPEVHTLVSASFHPTEPLIMLNYSQGAHYCLYKYKSGWTDAIRLCRGIVFDHKGNLVALSFPKFFNYGEHPETLKTPDCPYEITNKYDGHLGIIFFYNDKVLLTTRGSFESKTALRGQELIDRIVSSNLPLFEFLQNHPEITLLVEMINEDTHVIVNYGDRDYIVLIGASDTKRLVMLDRAEVSLISKHSGIGRPIVRNSADLLTPFNPLEMIKEVSDESVKNLEGYVVFFPETGLRIKFKYRDYLGKMIGNKIEPGYLMNHYMAGDLDDKFSLLPEEGYEAGLRLLGQIMLLAGSGKTPKEKAAKLFTIFPPELRTTYRKGICNNFTGNKKKLSIPSKEYGYDR